MEDHDRSKRRLIADCFMESNGVIINSDTTENILSRIPIEFVSRSRAVCKLWRNHLQKPKTGFLFTGKDLQICYQDEYAEDEEEVNVKNHSFQSLTKINHGLGQKYIPILYGSCNGLICFPDIEKEKLVYICNPMTGEYIYLPDLDFSRISSAEVFGGFGYSLLTNEYKVVQVYYETIGSVGRVQVYTLGAGNGWRYKGEIPYTYKQGAVYANNSLYLLEYSAEKKFKNIIAFDLVNETFSILPLPSCFESFERVYCVSLSGSLGVYYVKTTCSFWTCSDEEDSCLDIWILKKEKKKKNEKSWGNSTVDENDDSNPLVWSREFSIKYKSCYGQPKFEPFAITTSNQILLWEKNGGSKYLLCYDPKTLTLKKLYNEYVTDAQAIPHMNSFVSLKNLGESWSKWYALDDAPTDTIKSKAVVRNILGTSNGLIKNLNVDLTAIILSHFPIECVSLGRAVCRLWRILLKKPKTGFLLAVSEEKRTGEIQMFHRYIEKVSIHDEPSSYKKLAKIDLGLGEFQHIHVKLIKNGPVRQNIFGSCNGLVCFPVQKDEKKWLVYICNPMTGEYVYLPEMDFGEISRPKVLGGFGYCKSTNEYKVVQVTYEYSQSKQLGRVQVYTLGGGCGWRNKGGIPYTCQERLVFANEALYWIERVEDEWNIRVFYLADETFGTIPMPPCHDLVSGYKGLIVTLNGCLCVYHDTIERISYDEAKAYREFYDSIMDDRSDSEEEIHNGKDKEERRIDMWILKKEQKKKKKSEWYSPMDENDDSNSWVWVREVSIRYNFQYPYYRHNEPFSITDNNQVLMWEDRKLNDYKVLTCYDPYTLTFKNLCHLYKLDAQAIPHMNSFVSLEDLGEKSARYINVPEDSPP